MIDNKTWDDIPEGAKFELLNKAGLLKKGKTTKKITRRIKILLCNEYFKQNGVITK